MRSTICQYILRLLLIERWFFKFFGKIGNTFSLFHLCKLLYHHWCAVWSWFQQPLADSRARNKHNFFIVEKKKFISKRKIHRFNVNDQKMCFVSFFIKPIIIGMMKNRITPIIKTAYIAQSDSLYLAPVSLFSFHSMSYLYDLYFVFFFSSSSSIFAVLSFTSIHSLCLHIFASNAI